MTPEEKFNAIAKATKEYFNASGAETAVFGLSCGIDSTLVGYILAEALPKKKITALLMPDSSVNSCTLGDESEVAAEMGVNYVVQPIDKVLGAVSDLPWKQSRLAASNSKARARMLLLYNFANSNNSLVIGTGNKSELMLGYFTKHGDGACDFLPIGDLFKTEVFEVAQAAGVPEEIISKPPSAGLYNGQTDEQELGYSYETIDPVLRAIEQRKSEAQLKTMFERDLVEKVIALVGKNRHKSLPAPVAKLVE